MSLGLRRPSQAVDLDEAARLFPPPPEYFERAWFADPDEIDRTKLARMRRRAEVAATVPFFARRWAEAEFRPHHLRSLDDLRRAPTYDVDDIRRSIDAAPPYGDYQGVSVEGACSEPVRVHMSGGTTGTPRPTLYTQWDREVGGILTARGMYLQGIRPGDVVLNSWSYGLHNGAFAFDEALYKWLNCVVIPTSTGNVTSTRKQLELARRYRAAAILTTGDYLLRIVEEARESGIDPKSDMSITSLATNIGNESLLEEIFGVRSHASYAVHELQYVAVECHVRDGLHVFEDAIHVEVVDPDTLEPVADGEMGTLVLTEYYKTGSPQFRFNTMDLSYLYPREQCSCGSWLRRIGRFAGRADNMVKLRGVNVWPEGVGRIATSISGVGTEYYVRAETEGGQDKLTAVLETAVPSEEREALRGLVEERLHEQLGVRVPVELVDQGQAESFTSSGSSPKPKRFQDLRVSREDGADGR